MVEFLGRVLVFAVEEGWEPCGRLSGLEME
jgi:hypothetical protein